MKQKTNHDKKIFCIIPAWNEEKNIERVINSVKPYIKNIVIIDDNSSDNTYKIAKKHSDITVLKHIVNRGQGAALETGNQHALLRGADIIVHFDADGQFLASEIEDLTKVIIDGQADIVFGSRFLGKNSNIPFFKKYFILQIGHIVNKIIIGRSLSDSQIGFRALSRKAAKKIQIEQDRMAHASEIIHKTFKNNLKFKEIPATVIYNEFGQGLGGGIKIVKDLILHKIL